MSIFIFIIACILFAILGPLVGGLLAGLDRKISARMQGRPGPPILQPFYDVGKLLNKEKVAVNGVEGVYIVMSLIMVVLAGGVFFGGGNLLLCIFLVTLSSLFFIAAAYCTRSPYAEIGGAREMAQVMSYEPAVLLFAVVFYVVTGSFNTAQLLYIGSPIITYAFFVFVSLLFILTIKLRKSPFDISMSHHAHQEIVRGMTTEMSGSTLAKVEIMHWCETVLFLGWIGAFFLFGSNTLNFAISLIFAIMIALLAWFLEIFIDNNFARVKWQAMLKWAWIVALVCGILNVVLLVCL